MRTAFAIGLVAILSGTAFAQDANDIYLGEPDYGGSGCPDGTVSTILSDDAQSLSVLFDEYIAETDGKRRRARSSCNIAVPVHVPQGWSVSLIGIDYRGYAEIPNKGKGVFSVEYFFAGHKGPKYSKTFKGGYEDDFMIDNDLLVGALVWSKCGTDVILRANTSLRTQKRKTTDWEAYMALDSADFDAGILYKLQWRSC